MQFKPQFFKELSIETFVALDIETTGLDPNTSEILEIGMVRVHRGEVREHYHQLFKPKEPIPREITQLTGIRNDDCIDKPNLDDRLTEIVSFLNVPWIIAHNAYFDISFIQKVLNTISPVYSTFFQGKILDTLEISRLLLPWISNHKLGTLADFFSVAVNPSHRALTDAVAAAEIFLGLVKRLLVLKPEQIELILRILSGSNDGFARFMKKMQIFLKSHDFQPVSDQNHYAKNILGKSIPFSENQIISKTRESEVDQFFTPGGILGKVDPQYEFRKPQLDMARRVLKALNQELFLIAEAGTGVGKSLAYLVPVILWVINTHERVIVATYTKTLQEQLFDKELPLLFQCYSKPCQAVLLKGRSNYLCLNRWNQLKEELNNRLSSNQKRRLLPLIKWVDETRTGDIEENQSFLHQYHHDLWSQLNCDAGSCLGQSCSFETSCFLNRIRRVSRSANIVIINHSLLFSDLVNQNSILGDYDTLIVDEAHQIERIASQYMGHVLQYYLFKDVVQRIVQTKPEEVGVLISLRNTLKDHPIQDQKKLKKSIDRLIACREQLQSDAFQFFKALERIVSLRLEQSSRYQKLRFRSSDEWVGLMQDETGALEKALLNTEKELNKLIGHYSDSPFKKDHLEFEIISIMELIIGLRELLRSFIQIDYHTHVVWCELEGKREEGRIKLFMVPLDMAGLLDKHLYPKLKRCILTSATFTVCHQFEYLMHRLGLDRKHAERIHTQFFGSPFCFPEQMLFLIPTYISSPKDPEFNVKVIQCLEKILRTFSLGTMVLFTSHAMLQQAYHAILPLSEEKDIRLLGQGMDGSRSMLLKRFREDVNSILMGTNSYWEGVDVPGDALELLIITKLPFHVPTEPFVEAQFEKVQSETGNGFLNYAVPEAIVRLRQGFGRLIRSQSDRGVVVLLDNRIVQTVYGKFFLESLPVEPKICQTEKEFFTQLERWYG